jgi:hypothetical protein
MYQPYVYGTMREFHTKQFTVIADAIEETDMDLSWDEDGSVARDIDSGKLSCFVARVRVFLGGREVGSDYLGNCVYQSVEDFMDHQECGKQNRQYAQAGETGRCGSYFSDMIHAAIAEARKTLKAEKQQLTTLYIR